MLIGRRTALLPALVPGLAGMSGLSWGRFLPYNLLGGLIWASAVASLGYLAGASLAVVQQRLGLASTIMLGVLVAAALVMYVHAHVRRRQSKL